MILNMFSDQISCADCEWILRENFKFPRHHAATLLFNSCVQDWRDTISTIKLPTLIIGGEKASFRLIVSAGYKVKLKDLD